MAAHRLAILVIEDDDQIRPTFQRALQDHGYTVEVSRKTHDVVRVLRAAPPAALLLDLRLDTPGVGWDILAAVRADRRLKGLSIVAMSGDDLPTDAQIATLDALRVVLIKTPMLVEDLLTAIEDARLLVAYKGRATLDWNEEGAE